MFQIGHELRVLLCVLTFRDVDYCADDLLHTAVFVATKHLVARMKPAPITVVDAVPEFKLSRFTFARTGKYFQVVKKESPVVRVHHRADEARLSHSLVRDGTESVRKGAVDEGDSLLPYVVDGNAIWQCIDDHLDKAFTFDRRLNCFSVSIKEEAEHRTGESQAEYSGQI